MWGTRALHLIAVMGLAAGCRTSEGTYCANDQACRNPARQDYDPKKSECHGEGHFCYEGCASDADCTDQSKPWFAETRPACDIESRDCVGLGTKTRGEPCASRADCAAGLFCVDKVCCTSECTEGCKACNLEGSVGDCVKVPAGSDPRGKCAGSDAACAGACDGQGACTFMASQGKTCGGPGSCSTNPGKRNASTCTEGQCSSKEEDCGLYACSAGACKTSCAGQADCVAPAQCVGSKCVANLGAGEPCGKNNDACESKSCVDGVCCKVTSCPACQKCASKTELPSAPGTCTALPAGTAPSGQCLGDPECDAGKCDGKGACAYKADTTECKASCSSGMETISKCTTGKCSAQPSQPCGAYFCNATAGRCYKGCNGLVECVVGGLCDRALAHTAAAGGAGVCVGPAQVVIVKQGTVVPTVTAGVNGTSTSKPYVRVESGTYSESVTVGKTYPVKIIGVGTPIPTIQPPSSNVPGVLVNAGANLLLQGVRLYLAAGGDNADGVQCIGAPANKGKLAVVESEITDNKGQGVEASYCDVTLHRNRILSNSGGGASLSNGTFVVVNNVVAGSNGSTTSTFGGFILSPGAGGSVTFWNNTVTGNVGTVAGGVQCVAPVLLVNSILWNNAVGAQQTGCTLQATDVQGGAINANPAFDASYKPTAGVFNIGSPASSITVIDITNGPRQKGSAVDLGAFEVQ